MIKELSIRTSSQVELIDITGEIEKLIRESKVKSGLLTVFVPHTTAGITINENADPSVRKDIIKKLSKVIPFDDNYYHSEGNSAAHIKASLVGFSETIFFEDKRLLLGTWQGIYFCEFDGPRTRKVWVKILEG